MPETLTELHNTIRQQFEIQKDFRIQFMDPDFNNEFMNVTSVQDIQDRSTMKLVYNNVGVSPSSPLQNACSPSLSSGSPVSSKNTASLSPLPSASPLPTDSDNTIILSHSDSELRARAWPREFSILRFPYDVELQLQRGNESFRETGSLKDHTRAEVRHLGKVSRGNLPVHCISTELRYG